MTTYISILRGINVSGHNIIKMEALKKSYTNLGFKNIITYIQSGNVIFQSVKSKPEVLENKIKNIIFSDYGFSVPVIIKEIDNLNKIISDNPFLNRKDINLSKLHVTFLSSEPVQSKHNLIKDSGFYPDEFIILGDVIYLFVPEGYGNTKLNIKFFENKLSVSATNRNWKTVNELYKISLRIENPK